MSLSSCSTPAVRSSWAIPEQGHGKKKRALADSCDSLQWQMVFMRAAADAGPVLPQPNQPMPSSGA